MLTISEISAKSLRNFNCPSLSLPNLFSYSHSVAVSEYTHLPVTYLLDLVLMIANQRFREKEEEFASKYFAALNFSFEKDRFPSQESELDIEISHGRKK